MARQSKSLVRRLFVAIIAANASGILHAGEGSPKSDVSISAAVNQSASVETEPGSEEKRDSNGTADSTSEPNSTRSSASSPIVFPRFVQRHALDASGTDQSRTGAAPWYRSALGSLTIVLAVIGLLFFALKRWLPAKRWTDGAKVMSVAARTMIDSKHGLALVKVGRRFVMVGVSPDRLTPLVEISDATEVAELIATTNSVRGGRSAAFDQFLRHEADTYDDLVDDAKVTNGIARSHGDRSPKALRKLIGRLRSLQSSHAD